ncbi:DUF3747 domain-containing protein [Synechococcus sp. CS-1328]|uniref:DUF3747 domain-containing protein n=1 Tax=Synechococcus sp. CS-1328 TaxID=2847976 RepID=UPI00223A6971|nr:DUF3747 domain-containing protein [Synechococcus sp. CS-1328]MCT0223713.1 DUF3747 domain-containing protein [Synechococcus sp. CS-1328]
MKRTYLALAGLAVAGSVLPAVAPPLARAAGLFSSQPLEASRFAVLGRPVGSNGWNLLVLEQIKAQPLCWEKQSDGLVDPALNRFDFTGICSRYLDSNGYSLRVGDQDLVSRYRLRLQQEGSELQLQAMSGDDPTVLVVGRGAVPRRDRNGFVAIELDPGWQLQRRTFNEQTLSHIYFANGTPLAELIAKASGGSKTQPDGNALALATGSVRPAQLSDPTASSGTSSDDTLQASALSSSQPGQTVSLPVIPFQE